MGDWEPKVVQIEKVVNHPNGDNLDIATVLGDYPVIVKRNEYQVGDLAAYVPIDSIVPDTEAWYFLSPKAYEKFEENGEIKQRQVGSKYLLGSVPDRYRTIKARRLRGTYSQGLLAPVPIINGSPLPLGASVVEALNLTKWEEQEEENIPNAPKLRGKNAASPPKGWSIPHYDIDGIRKYLSCFVDGEEVVISEKIHGSYSGYVWDGEKLWSKSRNFYKQPDPEDPWVLAAIQYDLENKLKRYPMLAFFGELYGANKGFPYDLQIVNGKMGPKLAFFDIFDVQANHYLDWDQMIEILKELDLPSVPLLYRGPWKGKEEMYPLAEGMTMLGGKHVREGLVVKPIHERYEPRLDGRLILKLVGEGYNLQK